MPTTILAETAASLSELKNNPLATVAAGDGIVFKMQKPTNEEAEGSVSSFFTRKGYYAFGCKNDKI